MTKEENQKKAQQKYMELQMFDSQLKQIQQQVQTLENQAVEVEIIIEGLEGMKQVGSGSEILVPLANGIFAKAKLLDSENLIVNIGSNTAVTKKVDSTKDMMTSQVLEIRAAQEQLSAQFNIVLEKARQTEVEMQELVK
ncbi:MAG: prefoldin subunit alpha [Nanoarchaeota archaeon]